MQLFLHLDEDKYKKFNWMINTDHSPQTQRLMTPKGIIMRATRRQAMLPSGVTNCYHRLLSMRIFFLSYCNKAKLI